MYQLVFGGSSATLFFIVYLDGYYLISTGVYVVDGLHTFANY